MKRLLSVASIVLATSAMAFAQGGVEKALMDLERQWVKAGLASNGEALAPLLSSDFTSVQSDGTVQAKACTWPTPVRPSGRSMTSAI